MRRTTILRCTSNWSGPSLTELKRPGVRNHIRSFLYSGLSRIRPLFCCTQDLLTAACIFSPLLRCGLRRMSGSHRLPAGVFPGPAYSSAHFNSAHCAQCEKFHIIHAGIFRKAGMIRHVLFSGVDLPSCQTGMPLMFRPTCHDKYVSSKTS